MEQTTINTEAEDKIARQRLSVLEPARTLGNVAEACRRRGIARQSFYEYKKTCCRSTPSTARM